MSGGDIVTLIGSNGAGKTTTLRAISGLVKASGQILYQGRDMANLPPARNRRGRNLPRSRRPHDFRQFDRAVKTWTWALTCKKTRPTSQSDREFVFGMFPRLPSAMKQIAGTLSGGEQQMLAIGRALDEQAQVSHAGRAFAGHRADPCQNHF